MKFVVKCPHCENPFTVEANWAGQITSCPICNHQVRVPQPPSGAASADEPRPFTAVPPVYDSGESHGESFSGEACVAFFVTLLCCMPLGVILAVRAHSKMRENNNYSGKIWVYLSYIYAVVCIIGALSRMVVATAALKDLHSQGAPGLIKYVKPQE